MEDVILWLFCLRSLHGMLVCGILDIVTMRIYLMRREWAFLQRIVVIDVVGTTFIITGELGLGLGCLYRRFRIVLSIIVFLLEISIS